MSGLKKNKEHSKVTEKFCQCFTKHIAKYSVLNEDLLWIIRRLSRKGFLDLKYFFSCLDELKIAKSIKLKDCWIAYSNLILDSNKKLKNYVNNPDVLYDVRSRDLEKLFPIFHKDILEKIRKGEKKRYSYDDSRVLLSEILPLFNPEHLIIRDVLEHFSTKELNKFCT